MQIKTLYRYQREDGGTTVSTEKPDTQYEEVYRLIADKDKAITKDNIKYYPVIDVDNTDGYTEVDAPPKKIPSKDRVSVRTNQSKSI